MPRTARLALAVLLALPAAAAARCPAGSALGAFVKEGPYGVGERTLTFVDTSRPSPAHGSVPAAPSRTLVTEVWYPTEGVNAVPPLPIAHGKHFPLVFDSPGLLDSRIGRAYYAKVLASRGYVVASADFPETGIGSIGNINAADVQHQPGDVSFVIDSLLALAKTKGSWLAGGIDRRKIGVSGLSLGGLTTLLVTYHPTLRDPRVRASLAIAPVACFFGPAFYRDAKPPLLVLQGDQDLLVPIEQNGGLVFQDANSPRELVALVHGTHTAFAGAIAMPSATSYDVSICPIVTANATTDPTVGLGGAADGIDFSQCTELLQCQPPGPPNPPMQALRQHDIATAVVSAFFDATFRHSHAARCLLDKGLAAQPDVHVTTAPGRRLPHKR
jgi:predicted dienelactone hydrolase